MDDEATVMEFKRRGERAAVAALLREIADGIERGRVELREGDDLLVVEPPEHLEIEIEVEIEDEGDEGLESSIEIEISWLDARPRGDPGDGAGD
jgi:amphi-Trp domain-containing protein